MRYKGYILLIFCSWLIVSCRPKDTDRLEKALQLSGEHRGELEKVLAYFSKDLADSLKLQSAIFLIENMPGHWGPDSTCIQDYKSKIDSIPHLSAEERCLLLNLPSQHPELLPQLIRAEDIHTIRATDLIRHIEWACTLKDSCTWLKHIPFELFSEYLLPYRAGNEYMEFTYNNSNKQLAATIAYAYQNYDDCQRSPSSIINYIEDQQTFHYPCRTTDSLLRKLISSPENQNLLSVMRLIRMGIPVISDFDPISRQQEKNNYWHLPADSRLIPKSVSDLKGFCTGKVYRKTFSPNPVPVSINNEFIPSFFRNPFQKDVTNVYLHTTGLTLPVNLPDNLHYAYLAMYDDKEWHPIAYSKANQGQCLFTNLGKDCVYLPVYYPDSLMHPLSAPFILQATGQTQLLTVPKDSVTDLHIERLFPYPGKNNAYLNRSLVDSWIECADNKDFKNSDTVYIFKEPVYYQTEPIHPVIQLKRRYWRLWVKSRYTQLSEFQFLDSAGEQIKGKYFSQDTSHMNVLTDNDPLTNKIIWTWIYADFEKPVEVNSIYCFIKQDGGNIEPEHEYELFFYEAGKWLSAGKQTAADHSISFRKVPANRLYQLTDKTRKKRGQAFTWEKGRVRFW